MKNLINIIEGLKINSKSKINNFDWSIENAEDGDFVKWHNIYFIFKSLNKGHKYSDLDENTIIYYCTYNKRTDLLRNKIGCGVGTTDSKSNYYLMNNEEKENFIKILNDKGYKWDENKKELVKK